MSNQKAAEIVKLYFETKSPVTVIRMIQKKYPEDDRLTKLQIHQLVNRFQQTGSVEDSRHNNGGRPRSSRSFENVAEIQQVIQETPQKSVRKVLGDITNRCSYSTVYRALRFDLSLFPYSLSIMQHLKETDINSRLDFARWMIDNEDVIEKIWFSDESHFYLNTAVNKQNCRVWGKEKPNFYIEKPLHDEKVTVWAAMSSVGVIGPFFFESDGDVKTINSDRYLSLLKTKFLPALRRKDIGINTIWFQQDGATPHTAGKVLDWLRKTFGRNFISFKSDTVWPPHSPDLSPLDFFLWGHLKDNVYNPKPDTIEQLKAAIRREMRKITPAMCANVLENFKKRLDVVIAQKGRHIEHLM